jgi:uncharacterized protein (TIGR03435 family)
LALAGALALCRISLAQRPAFEVASLKRNTASTDMDVVPRRSGDLVTMHNAGLYSMIFYAYHLHFNYEIAGYKDFQDPWRWYDLDARIGRQASEDEVRLMMQSLLEDRFQLQVHHETREVPVYDLSVVKGKLKLTPPSEGPTMTAAIEGRKVGMREGTCGRSGWNDGIHLMCHDVGIGQLVSELSAELTAPVTDHTGLANKFDVHIHYVPESRKMEPGLELGLTLVAALQEELGLKMEKSKGPVEVLVIDRMEKPSENN